MAVCDINRVAVPGAPTAAENAGPPHEPGLRAKTPELRVSLG